MALKTKVELIAEGNFLQTCGQIVSLWTEASA